MAVVMSLRRKKNVTLRAILAVHLHVLYPASDTCLLVPFRYVHDGAPVLPAPSLNLRFPPAETTTAKSSQESALSFRFTMAVVMSLGRKKNVTLRP